MLLRNRLTAHDKRIIGTMRQTYSLDGKKKNRDYPYFFFVWNCTSWEFDGCLKRGALHVVMIANGPPQEFVPIHDTLYSFLRK
jgi:hypothetical protein